MKKSIAALVAAGALLVLAAPATAIPVRFIDVSYNGRNAAITADVWSPPAADSCGANYVVALTRLVDRTTTFKNGRINVCRTIHGGWSQGQVRVSFDRGRGVPYDRYVVSVTARQSVNGVSSSHTIHRIRWI